MVAETIVKGAFRTNDKIEDLSIREDNTWHQFDRESFIIIFVPCNISILTSKSTDTIISVIQMLPMPRGTKNSTV